MIHGRLAKRSTVAAVGALLIAATLPAIANTLRDCMLLTPIPSPAAVACEGTVAQFTAAPRDLLSAQDGRLRVFAAARAGTAAESFVQSGLAWEAQGALSQARAAFDRAISLDPGAATAYLARAHVRTSLADNAGAVADYGESIARGVDGSDAYTLRGLAHASANNQKAALADFDAALTRMPTLSAALCGRGLALRATGDFARAEADFASAARFASAIDAPVATSNDNTAHALSQLAAADPSRLCTWMTAFKGYTATALRPAQAGLRIVRRLSFARTA